MFRKSVSTTLMAVATMSLLTTVACSKANKGNDGYSAAALSPGADVSAPPYVPGVPSHSSDVVSISVFATEGGAASGAALDPIYAAYPVLEADAVELGKINRSVVTTDNHIELYNSADLVMALSLNGSDASVVWTVSDFSAESITYTTSAVDPKSMSGQITYNMKACTTPAPDQGKQGQDKGPAPQPVCQTISAIIDTQEQVLPPKQDQGKQDQGKGDQGQAPAPVKP